MASVPAEPPPGGGMDAPPLIPTLTPEQLAALPHDNAGPQLNAVMWSLLAISSCFLALRIYCKVFRHSRLWWDDYVLIASWVCIVVESCCLSFTISIGYGVHIWDAPYDTRLLPLINVAGTFTVTAAIWSKTSFAFTLLRLTEGWTKWAVWFIIISMNVSMGLSGLFIWIQCKPVKKTWDPFFPGKCWPPEVLVHYDIFSAVYSALMDIALAILPWKLVWGLQMKRKEKIGVGIAMSMGIFAGVTAIVKTTKITNMLNPDFYAGVELWMWGNAETNVTIVAASIPVLRVLFKEVHSSARRYYISADDHTVSRSGIRTQNTITISAGRNPSRHQRIVSQSNDDSDRSILEDKPGQILRTNEVAVEYHRKDHKEEEIEMKPIA